MKQQSSTVYQIISEMCSDGFQFAALYIQCIYVAILTFILFESLLRLGSFCNYTGGWRGREEREQREGREEREQREERGGEKRGNRGNRGRREEREQGEAEQDERPSR